MHKIMAMVFQDYKSILQMDFLLTGETINAAHYNNTLHTVREAVWRKIPEQLNLDVTIFHYSATPHTAKQCFKW